MYVAAALMTYYDGERKEMTPTCDQLRGLVNIGFVATDVSLPWDRRIPEGGWHKRACEIKSSVSALPPFISAAAGMCPNNCYGFWWWVMVVWLEWW